MFKTLREVLRGHGKLLKPKLAVTLVSAGPRFTHGEHRGQPVLKLLEDLAFSGQTARHFL